MKNLQFHEFIHPGIAASKADFRRNEANSPAPGANKTSSVVSSKKDVKLTEDWIFVYSSSDGANGAAKKFCLYDKEKVGFGNPHGRDYKVLAIGSLQWFNRAQMWWTPFTINKATRPTTFTVEPVFPNTSAVQIMENLSDSTMEVTSEFKLQVGVNNEDELPLYLVHKSSSPYVYCYDCTLEEHEAEFYTWRLKRWKHKEPQPDDPEAELWYMQNVGTGQYLMSHESWYVGTDSLSNAARFCVYS